MGTKENFDLSELDVDPKSLDAIPDLEPDYSFNMDDVYDSKIALQI